MKNVSKLLGLVLAVAALLLSACSKKPVRSLDQATATGPSLTPTPMDAAQDLPPGLQDRLAVGTPNGDQSVVEPIYFALDRSAVSQAERPKLQAAVKWLKDNADKNLVMIGHCDWRGTAEYNLGLGDRRANAVKKFLESLGVDGKRLETLSKGSTDAKQAGGESEWQKDRRVDFVELKK